MDHEETSDKGWSKIKILETHSITFIPIMPRKLL